MGYKTKSWQEKLEDSKELPKIEKKLHSFCSDFKRKEVRYEKISKSLFLYIYNYNCTLYPGEYSCSSNKLEIIS